MDNPLGALYQLCDILIDKPMLVPWDSTVLRRDNNITSYLYKQNVLELAFGKEESNITLIQL